MAFIIYTKRNFFVIIRSENKSRKYKLDIALLSNKTCNLFSKTKDIWYLMYVLKLMLFHLKTLIKIRRLSLLYLNEEISLQKI